MTTLLNTDIEHFLLPECFVSAVLECWLDRQPGYSRLFSSQFFEIQLTFNFIFLCMLQILFSCILKIRDLSNLNCFFPALTYFIYIGEAVLLLIHITGKCSFDQFSELKLQYKLVYNLNISFMFPFESIIFALFFTLFNWQSQRSMKGDVGLIENHVLFPLWLL